MTSASTRPSRSRTASTVSRSALDESSWSSIDSASRMPPAAWRATSAMASGSAVPAVGLEDRRQLALDLGDGQRPEVEPLDARQDGRPDLRCVGRAEDERDVVGRLLERPEQDVPALLDPLDLVDDVDLAAQVGRGRPRPLEQARACRRPCCSTPRRARRRRAPGPPGSPRRRRTDVARVAVLEVRAVERLGDDPGHRRLARPARPDEQQGVGDLARPDGVAERRDDGVLADDLAERLGAPAPVQGKVRTPSGGATLPVFSSGSTPRSESGSKVRYAVHPPSIGRSRAHASRAARTRPFRGTRR